MDLERDPHPHGQIYAGEVRAPYKAECDALPDTSWISATPSGHEDDDCFLDEHAWKRRHRKFKSLEGLDEEPPRKTAPRKPETFLCGVMFCGAGIASKGAELAGLKVVWGLDAWDKAIKAWSKNFPSGIDLNMDARDFGDSFTKRKFGAHIIHFPPPFQYGSCAHTKPGKDD